MGVSFPTAIARDRVCLKCNQTFFSRGPANRICPRCNQLNAKLVLIPDRMLQSQRGQKYRNGDPIEAIDQQGSR
jgi:hypothetical protein